MSEPIKEGDLVQVVRWPCCGVLLGSIFTVAYFTSMGGRGWKCSHCKHEVPEGPWAVSAEDQARLGGHISWLKRIPPLAELGQLTTEQWMKVNA